MKNAIMYQHLRCTNDTNGNPRRVFVAYSADGSIVRAYNEGYAGTPKELRGLIELPGYNIMPADRRELLKNHGA